MAGPGAGQERELRPALFESTWSWAGDWGPRHEIPTMSEGWEGSGVCLRASGSPAQPLQRHLLGGNKLQHPEFRNMKIPQQPRGRDQLHGHKSGAEEAGRQAEYKTKEHRLRITTATAFNHSSLSFD